MGSCRDRLIAQSLTSRYSDWILEVLNELPDNFLITDPGISNYPIVFASRGFLAMSGYAREEVVGRNVRIFQGPATDRRSVIQIWEVIREERPLHINLLNYRKDGTPHWILFHLFLDGRWAGDSLRGGSGADSEAVEMLEVWSEGNGIRGVPERGAFGGRLWV